MGSTKRQKSTESYCVLFLEDQAGLKLRGGGGVAGIFSNSVNKTNSTRVNHQNESLELFVCCCSGAWLKQAT